VRTVSFGLLHQTLLLTSRATIIQEGYPCRRGSTSAGEEGRNNQDSGASEGRWVRSITLRKTASFMLEFTESTLGS
jgi:hypothetical protein